MSEVEDVKFIKELAKRNDLNVEVVLKERVEDGIVINTTYPGNVVDSYLVYFDGHIGINEEVVFIHPSLIRMYVALDIFREMRVRKLTYITLDCYDIDKNVVEDIGDLFPPHKSEGSKKLENLVVKAVTEIFENKKSINKFDEEMKQSGIYRSFNLMKGLLL